MTISGVDMMVALAMAAAIGKVTRFDEPQKLVSYLGLNPSVRQSEPGPAYHEAGAAAMRAACWSRRPGLQPEHWVPSGPSSFGSELVAVSTAWPSRPGASRDYHLASVNYGRELRVGATVPERQEAARS
jgi:Transposase IS116/IS110/IS902 family